MKCQKAAQKTGESIVNIAYTMFCKLKSYHIHINSTFARLARILNFRNNNNLETESVFLRNQNQLLEPSQSTRHQRKDSALDKLPIDDTSQDTTEDEISQLLRAPACAKFRSEVLEWWKASQERFPTLA